MNPYLEQPSVWTDFHNTFIAAARTDLVAQVDPAYFVAIDEHVYIHEWPVSPGRADTAVIEATHRRTRSLPGAIAVASATTAQALVSYRRSKKSV
jgi:hypothetical protein